MVITGCAFIFIDAIDECAKSEREILLMVLQDIMASCPSKVKVFLAVSQGIVEEMERICKSDYRVTMGSSEVDSNIKTYIEDVLVKRKDCGQLVVGNPELIKEITDALVREANGMLVCHTEALIPVLTEAGFCGWLFKLKIYAAKFVIVIFAKRFENSQKTSRRPTTASCQGSLKWGMPDLPKKSFPG